MEEEAKMKAEEVQREQNARLLVISNSVKSIGMMTGVGMTFCIVLPTGDLLTSNLLLSGEKPLKDQTEEIAHNVVAIVSGFMKAMHKAEIESEKIYAVVDQVVSVAKKDYEKSVSEITGQR